MKPRQIRFLFFMSLAELIGMYGCVMLSYMEKGNAPLAAGIVGLVIMACSFIGSVYGMFEMKIFKENHNYIGIVGTRLHMLVFLFVIILYAAGIVLSL